jgi:ADP-heptose:LPS heptosyltransferase
VTASTTSLGRPAKIAVFRALQLGDLLCAVPALRALRRAFPHARITLIGLPWARRFVERFPRYLDAFLAFPGFPGFPEQSCDVAALPAFLTSAQRERFDVALQMHGSGTLSNAVVAMLGARITAGFYVHGDHCPDPRRFIEWQARDREVDRYLSLLRALGVPADDAALEFPLDDADREELARAAAGHALGRSDYVCVHPGSQLPSRRWPPERFAAVADELAADGLRVVLTGVAQEAALTRAVAQSMRAPALDLAGKTTLGAAAALLVRARLLVANDTGVAHVAAALGTPTVRVCCGGDERRWAPADGSKHRVIAHRVSCRPCSHATCPIGHPCATGVPVAAVVEAARTLLAQAAARGRDSSSTRFTNETSEDSHLAHSR